MARHGTLPEFMHQRQCEVTEKPISIAFDSRVSTAEAVTENETVEEAEDEFDESSDEEVDDDPEVSTLVQGKIGSSATFLLGARTRFGRAVRFNNDRRTVSLDDGSLRFRYFVKFQCGIAVFIIFCAVLRFSDLPYAPLFMALRNP